MSANRFRVPRQQNLMMAAVTLIAIVGVVQAQAQVYFLVAERPEFAAHGDSYVLPLSEPADIAHARALINAAPGELSSIAVANIAAGGDGFNRDHLAPGLPEWSWHVTSFDGFYDITAEILDGWPTFVESDVEGWIANTGGQIGFWNYTVVAELAPVPEPAAAGIVMVAALCVVMTCRTVRSTAS